MLPLTVPLVNWMFPPVPILPTIETDESASILPPLPPSSVKLPSASERGGQVGVNASGSMSYGSGAAANRPVCRKRLNVKSPPCRLVTVAVPGRCHQIGPCDQSSSLSLSCSSRHRLKRILVQLLAPCTGCTRSSYSTSSDDSLSVEIHSGTDTMARKSRKMSPARSHVGARLL